MCNKLHWNHEDISTEGHGWKLFGKGPGGRRQTLVFNEDYLSPVDGIVAYCEAIGDGDGFCFFLSKQEAERAKRAWNDYGHMDCYLEEIEYWGGKGQQTEEEFVKAWSFRIALCKKFRIVEEKVMMKRGGGKEGKHAYDGGCMPAGEDGVKWESFSVGIFAWEKMAKGNRLKRGKVKVRVRGLCVQAEAVYAKADQIVRMLDAGEYNGSKTVNLSSAKHQVTNQEKEREKWE